jgi:hypothetical protein
MRCEQVSSDGRPGMARDGHQTAGPEASLLLCETLYMQCKGMSIGTETQWKAKGKPNRGAKTHRPKGSAGRQEC